MIRFIQMGALALVFASSQVLAQDYDAGLKAYNAGNYGAALEELRPLAEQGNATAQIILARIYYNGYSVPKDEAQAAKWYRLAAEGGNAAAQFLFGIKYDYGLDVLQDYAQAIKWYRLAAEQGNAAAQYRLGRIYVNGLGVSKDFTTAHMWFNLASLNDNAPAGEYRDQIAEQMTTADISEAQRRARVCLESQYEDCD